MKRWQAHALDLLGVIVGWVLVNAGFSFHHLDFWHWALATAGLVVIRIGASEFGRWDQRRRGHRMRVRMTADTSKFNAGLASAQRELDEARRPRQ